MSRIVGTYNINLEEMDISDIDLNPELLLSIKMDYDASILDQTVSKIDETVLWVCSGDEKPEIIDLDSSSLKMEAISVGLTVKEEVKTPLNAAMSADKLKNSKKRFLEFLTPSRDSNSTEETINAEVKSPGKRSLPENSNTTNVLPSKIPKLSSHQSIQRVDEPLRGSALKFGDSCQICPIF